MIVLRALPRIIQGIPSLNAFATLKSWYDFWKKAQKCDLDHTFVSYQQPKEHASEGKHQAQKYKMKL